MIVKLDTMIPLQISGRKCNRVNFIYDQLLTAAVTLRVPTTIKGSNIPLSSNDAKSGRYAGLQANPQTAIYDGFYNIHEGVDTPVLPIETNQPAFQQFGEGIATAKPSRELLVDLMKESTRVGTVESGLAGDLRNSP